jgi:hypothetical protein
MINKLQKKWYMCLWSSLKLILKYTWTNLFVWNLLFFERFRLEELKVNTRTYEKHGTPQLSEILTNTFILYLANDHNEYWSNEQIITRHQAMNRPEDVYYYGKEKTSSFSFL